MNIVAHLQELDDLIVKHTVPPVTTMLRNKLAFCIEQASAHEDAVLKQDETLSRQIEAIEKLMKENADLKAEIARRDSDADSEAGGCSAW